MPEEPILNCIKVVELLEEDTEFFWENINFDWLDNYSGISTHNGNVYKILLHEGDEHYFVLHHNGVVDRKTGEYTLDTNDPIVKIRRFYFAEDFDEAQAKLFIRNWEKENG